jgi:ketosteroid isomerase-like protein
VDTEVENGAEIEARNKEIVGRAFEAWAAGTGGVFDLLEPDATWTIVGTSPVSRTFASRDEFLDLVIRPFNDRLSTPLVPVVHGLYADGDVVVAYFEASAMANDGQPYRNAYTWYLHLCEGRIVKAVAFFDTVEFTDFWERLQPTA